jgi:hypothetical protein
MIDSNWFRQVICMAGADIQVADIDRLCGELGEDIELLPYLLLKAGGFAEWPLARAALKNSVGGVIRPRVPPKEQISGGTSAQRGQLENALRAAITVKNPLEFGTEPVRESVARLDPVAQINAYRTQGSSRTTQPNCFITIGSRD